MEHLPPEPIPPVLDELLVPQDAGEHAPGLTKILQRIPSGWGRWISCGRGWYDRLVALDTEIESFLPDYEVHQVKEKYGELRYYIGLPAIEPECCVALAATRPHPGPVDPRYLRGISRTAVQQFELDEWCYTMHRPHFDSAEHAAGLEAIAPLVESRKVLLERAHECVERAERDLLSVCEECAAPGTLRLRAGWYKTLCDGCARTLGYLGELPVPGA